MSKRTRDACVKLAIDAGLGKTDAEELVDMMAKEKQRLLAEGRLSRAEAQLAEYVGRRVEDAKVNAALQRKHAALNIIARRNIEAQMTEFVAKTGNDVEAIMAQLGGSYKRVAGARSSASRNYAGLRDGFTGGMMNELHQRPHVIELLAKDKDFLDDVVREMHEIKPGGRKGISGNDDAAFAAEIFSRYAEDSRQRLNRAGAFIRKLDGWAPQTHDAGKMQAKKGGGINSWTEFVFPRLDLERTFPDLSPDEARAELGEVFKNIVTGKDRTVSGAEKGQFLGPRNLARGKGKSRVLHFKDADAFLQYQEKYGTGNVFTNMMHHLDFSARSIALMEKFGPNPETMIASLVDARRREIRLDKTLDDLTQTRRIKKLSRAFGKRSGKIRNLLSEMLGETLIPENITQAKLWGGFRAVQSMAKLGGVFLSQFNDLSTYAMSARVNGKNLFEAYDSGFKSLVGRMGKDEREVARSLGTMLDGMIQDMSVRWNAQDSIPGTMQKWQNAFFKATGTTYWTERLKAGYSMMLSNHLGDNSGKAWGELGEEIRAVLGHHGFGEEHWNVMRKVARKGPGGRMYLLPEDLRGLSVEDVASLVPSDTKPGMVEFRAKQTLESLETDLRGFYADETRFAVLEPDERTRAALLQGTRPGTWMGELLRFVAQFKSFPVAYTQRILMGRRWAKDGRGFDMPGFTHFIAASFILGYASMTAKDIAKGRTPRDPRKVETWISAGLQGGGAGIYGDFLFSKYNRFGQGPIDTLAGPGLGTLGDVVKMGSGAIRGEFEAGDALRLALDNTPFANLWYTKAALDYAVVYHLREMLSPGTLRRTERRLKEEFGQEYIVPPSSVAGK